MDSKLKSLDRSNIKVIRDAMQKALDRVEEMYGVKVSVGNIRFDNLSFTAKINAHITDPENAKSFEENQFSQYAFMFGFKPEDFNKEVTFGYGKRGTLVGFKPTSRKYPVLVRTKDGKTYRCPTSAVTMAK